MRRTERGGDGSDLDPERRRNASIIEIGVVAKEDNKALALRKQCDPAADTKLIVIVSVPRRRLESAKRLQVGFSPLCARGVDHDPPDPGLQRSFASKRSERGHRLRECLLDRLDTSCVGAGDRSRYTNESAVTARAQIFEIAAECCPSSPHAQTMTDEPGLFSRMYPRNHAETGIPP